MHQRFKFGDLMVTSKRWFPQMKHDTSEMGEMTVRTFYVTGRYRDSSVCTDEYMPCMNDQPVRGFWLREKVARELLPLRVDDLVQGPVVSIVYEVVPEVGRVIKQIVPHR